MFSLCQKLLSIQVEKIIVFLSISISKKFPVVFLFRHFDHNIFNYALFILICFFSIKMAEGIHVFYRTLHIFKCSLKIFCNYRRLL